MKYILTILLLEWPVRKLPIIPNSYTQFPMHITLTKLIFTLTFKLTLALRMTLPLVLLETCRSIQTQNRSFLTLTALLKTFPDLPKSYKVGEKTCSTQFSPVATLLFKNVNRKWHTCFAILVPSAIKIEI